MKDGRKRKRRKLIKRIISLVIVAAMVAGLFPMPVVRDGGIDIDFFSLIPPRTVHAGSVSSDFTTYTAAYNYAVAYAANPEDYENDDITIDFTNPATSMIDADFPGIGTEDHPFNGRIIIAGVNGDNGGYSAPMTLKTTLFNYITDKVEIVTSSNVPCTIYLAPEAGMSTVPLFAAHVVGSGTRGDGTGTNPSPVTWNFKITNGNARSSIIGSLEESTSGNDPYVNLSIENYSAQISGTGDLGLVCNTVSDGNLGISFTNLAGTTSTADASQITTTSGNIGGLVGSVASGAKVNINSKVSFTAPRAISTGSGYAGGMIGSCEGTVNFGSATYTDSQTTSIVGTSGSGGVFGYYSASDDVVFPNFDNFTVTTALSTPSSTVTTTGIWASGNPAGGFIGVLENKGSGKSITIQGSQNSTNNNNFFIGGSKGGGLIGLYKPGDLSNTLTIDTVYVKSNGTQLSEYYGGLIGYIEATGEDGGYISLNNVKSDVNPIEPFADRTVTNKTGGLIGYTKGGFIDVSGNVTVTGAYRSAFAGLIYQSDSGVIRLAGTTDLTGLTEATALLVNVRGNTLIYALGDGNGSGWTYKRPNVDKKIDDLNPWGQVVRQVDGNDIETAGIVKVSGHTVTLAAAEATMSSATGFAKTALNIQLNTAGKNLGALAFSDTSASSSVTLLSSPSLSLGGNIDLRGTGLTGLTRDNGSNAPFTGTFDGNEYTIVLATGEAYGYKGASDLATTGKNFTTSLVSGNNLTGSIASHFYNGLFAKVGACTISDLTLDGEMVFCSPTTDGFKVGGVAAEVTGGNASFSGINCNENIYLYDSDKTKYVGSLVGLVSDNTSTTTLEISDSGFDGSVWVDCKGSRIGYIGEIQDTSIDITMSGIDLTGNINYKGSDRPYAGGLIGRMSGGDYSRNLTLTDIDVDGLVVTTNMTGNNTVDGRFKNPSGALLGGQWLKTNVFWGNSTASDAVKVTDGTITLSGNATYAGGLVADATGYWQVNDIDITSMTISGASEGIGFLVMNGKNGSDGLYLELTSSSAFTIDSGITTVIAEGGSAPTIAYDEIMAFSKGVENVMSGTTVTGMIPSETNGQAVISIRTTDTSVEGVSKPRLSMISGSNNSYNPVTTLGSNHNRFSRYYYNLDYLLTNASEGGEKMLLWSVYQYATGNIRSNTKIKSERTKSFSDYTSLPSSGSTVDLQYLSYYPVDIGSLAMPTMTVKLHNSEMQTAHGGIYNLNDVDANDIISQHYLMHAGLFKNVTGALSIGSLTLQGDVSAFCSSGSLNAGSGSIICGKITGQSSESKASLTINGLILDGIKVNSVSGIGALIVKEIGDNTNINVSNVKTSAKYKTDGTSVAAHYLMGNAEGAAMTIVFDKMVLDGRSTTSIASTAQTALNTAYKTDKSIFDQATFLNSLVFETGSGSSAKYDYTHDEDWGTTLHQVTYGQEISFTTGTGHDPNHVDKMNKYVDSTDYYTSPEENNRISGQYDFSGFLPHVYIRYDESTNHQEIAVNIVSRNLDKGCGTYNDPYVISDGVLLATVATALNSGFSNGFSLCIDNDYISNKNINFEKWCANKTGHTQYTYNGSKFFDENNNELSVDVVTDYLAGAYYYIDDDISLPSNYVGLGGRTNRTAFRGVVVGGPYTAEPEEGEPEEGESEGSEIGESRYVRITNPSSNPIVNTSNGSVVKNIEVDVTAETITRTANDVGTSGAFAYSTTTGYYGGVIGEVMGGDNIIDNVIVTYDPSASISVSGTAKYNVPMGAYIGVVVNGSVFFRNMTTTTEDSETGEETTTCFANADSTNFHVTGVNFNVDATVNADGTETFSNLYVNPIIGRVINGFAIYESDAYRFSEDGYYVDKNSSGRSTARAAIASQTTLKNGRKNFSIPDFNSSSGHSVLTFSKSVSTSGYNDVITVSDAQSLYVMSLICQTNMGSATGDSAAYSTKTDSGYDGNTKNYKATHLGYYSDVYTITDKNANYNRTLSEKANDNTQVPYLIYEYTNHPDASNKFPARTLTNRNSGYSIIIDSNSAGTLYLPDSFRGIGSIKTGIKMTLKGFTGNNKTIDLNTYFRTYESDKDNYYGTSTEGIALFNMYSPVPGCQFQNLKLSGYISAKRISTSDGLVNCTSDVNKYWIVGGIVANETNSVTHRFNNVDFENLFLDSKFMAGAFFGSISKGVAYIDNSDAVKLKISGYQQIGGMIGNKSTTVYINNSENAVSNYEVNIHQLVDGNNNTYSGGLIGASSGELLIKNVSIKGWSGNYTSESTSLSIIGRSLTENIANRAIISGGAVGSISGKSFINNVNVTNVNISGGRAGGIVGSNESDAVSTNISNCTVVGDNSRSYTIRGSWYSGGIIGYYKSINTGSNSTYNQRTFAVNNITYNEEINSCQVSFYRLKEEQVGTANADSGIAGVGGIIGISRNNKILHNLKVDNCEIIGKSGDYAFCGGIAGTISKYHIYAYNVDINNLTFTCSDEDNSKFKYGLFVAKHPKLGTDSGNINLVGLSIDGTNTLSSDNSNATIIVGPDYSNVNIIRADYSGVCNTDDKGTKLSSINNSNNVPMRSKTTTTVDDKIIVTYGAEIDTETDTTVNDIFPYVVSSPYVTIGDKILTGDGIKIGKADAIITGLASDSVSAANKYSNVSAKDIAIYNKIVADGKISTYNTEYGTELLTDDIPVIVMDDPSYSFSVTVGETTYSNLGWTDAIQAYIRILSNTTKIYNNQSTDTSNGKIYNIDILKCKYSEGTLTTYSSGATIRQLSNAAGTFEMVSGEYDSSTPGQFSLIDVKYKDPLDGNSSYVAYHLYIPVFTKKMFNFKFDVTALSGTSYYPQTYTGGTHFSNLDTLRNNDGSNTVVENYGSPVTMYMRYEYAMDDIISDILAGGYGLDWNYNKTLDFIYNYSNDNALTSGTKFVLVDVNQKDKVSYSGGFSASANADLTINGAIFPDYSISGVDYDAFSVVSFADLMTNQSISLTATSITGEQALVATVPVFHAEAEDDEDTSQFGATNVPEGMKLVPASSDDISAGTGLYTVSAGDDVVLKEDYYLTFYVPADDDGDIMHQLTVTSQKSLSAGDKIMANCSNNDSEFLVFANLFSKDIDVKTFAENNSAQLMGGEGSDKIVVQTVSSIAFNLSGSQLAEIVTLLNNRSIPIYHSALLHLIKQETGKSTTVAVDGTTFTPINASSVGTDGSNYVYNSGVYIEMTSAYDGQSNCYYEYDSNDSITGYYRQVVACNPLDPSVEGDVPDITGNRVTNFYEVKNTNNGNLIDLRPYITGYYLDNTVSSTARTVKVVANYEMTFTETGIDDQFPEREGNSTAGTVVHAEASLSYSPTGTTYSNNKSSLEEDELRISYYRAASSRTKLYYNVVSDDVLTEANALVKTNDSLGINKFDEDTNTLSEIKTYGEYSANQLVGASDKSRIKWTLSLYRRQPVETEGVAGAEYGDSLPINEYLDNIRVYGVDANGDKDLTKVISLDTDNSTGKLLTYVDARGKFEDLSRRSDLTNPDEKTNIFLIYIDYDVKTFSALENESLDHFYSNYKVVLTGELVGDSASVDSDYIIYTNARLDPTFVEQN